MIHERKRGSRGFSVAEVLIASVFLSVILLAMFGLVTQGVRRAYAAKQMTGGAVLAQAILERANVTAVHSVLGAPGTTTSALTYTCNSAGCTLTPAANVLADTTAAQNERAKWQTMLNDSDLSKPSFTVTVTPLPTGRTFDASAIVRIVVDLSWEEVFGGATIHAPRRRSVRLQTFNVRSANP